MRLVFKKDFLFFPYKIDMFHFL